MANLKHSVAEKRKIAAGQIATRCKDCRHWRGVDNYRPHPGGAGICDKMSYQNCNGPLWVVPEFGCVLGETRPVIFDCNFAEVEVKLAAQLGATDPSPDGESSSAERSFFHSVTMINEASSSAAKPVDEQAALNAMTRRMHGEHIERMQESQKSMDRIAEEFLPELPELKAHDDLSGHPPWHAQSPTVLSPLKMEDVERLYNEIQSGFNHPVERLFFGGAHDDRSMSAGPIEVGMCADGTHTSPKFEYVGEEEENEE